MPPAARHLAALRERGGKVVVVDPRRTATAEQADVHIQPVPGTDLALAQSVLHQVIANGDVDSDYVNARTSGFEAVRESVATWLPERGERVGGVAASEIRDLASLVGRAERGLIMTARRPAQPASGAPLDLGCVNPAPAPGPGGRPSG